MSEDPKRRRFCPGDGIAHTWDWISEADNERWKGVKGGDTGLARDDGIGHLECRRNFNFYFFYFCTIYSKVAPRVNLYYKLCKNRINQKNLFDIKRSERPLCVGDIKYGAINRSDNRANAWFGQVIEMG